MNDYVDSLFAAASKSIKIKVSGDEDEETDGDTVSCRLHYPCTMFNTVLTHIAPYTGSRPLLSSPYDDWNPIQPSPCFRNAC